MTDYPQRQAVRSIVSSLPAIHTRIINNAAADARAFADANGYPADGFADERNAIEHAYTSAQMALRNGRGSAEFWGGLKEFLFSDNAADSARDRYNNEVGRRMADWIELNQYAFQYFSGPTQQRIAAFMERIGADADEAAPLAWLRFEQQPGDDRASLRLRTWPGEEQLLAWPHGHGASVDWVAA